MGQEVAEGTRKLIEKHIDELFDGNHEAFAKAYPELYRLYVLILAGEVKEVGYDN